MGKLSYILGCVTRMDYPELFRTVGKVHKITGKNSVGILADVVKCGLKYGAGFNDYLLCEFYNLTDAQRATYITRSVNNTLVSLLNDREYYHFFDNKSEFYTTFGKYIGRQWLDFGKATQKEFEDFMASRDTIMVKPDSSSGGFGVNKLSKGDFPSLAAMYQKLKEEHIGVIEDVLQQHEVLNQLNPSSINTLRVVTILNESGPHIVYAHIRIGNSDRPVDNLHSGGMFAPIDLDKGVIQYPAYDKARHTYTEHPAPTPPSRALPSPIGRRPRPCAWRPPRLFPRCAMWAGTWPSPPTARCLWRATTCPATTFCKCRPTPRTKSACCPGSGSSSRGFDIPPKGHTPPFSGGILFERSAAP